MSLGKRLAELRVKRNLSQIELAKILNVSQSRISSYETDRRGIDTESLVTLAKFFNVSTDYLLGIEPKETLSEELIKTPEDKEFLDLKHTLTQEDQEEVKRFMQYKRYSKTNTNFKEIC